jgi:hypothetical protein
MNFMRNMLSCGTLIILFLVTTSACGTKKEIEQEKAGAEAVVEEYFNAIGAQDLDSALALYDTSFFGKKSRSESKQTLANILKDFGEVQSYQLLKWKGDKKARGPGAGFYWRFQYNVEYTNQVTTETIGLRKPPSGKYKIHSHNIHREE